VEKKRNNRGIALVAVIVTLILLFSITLVVFQAAGRYFKTVHWYEERMKAIEIAENAIQDVLNWMNYRAYMTGHYPSWYANNSPPNNPTRVYFDGQTFLSSRTKITAPYIPQKGECYLEFYDNEGENADTITATAKYKGKGVRVSVNIRGKNGYDHLVHKEFALVLRDIPNFSQVFINFQPSSSSTPSGYQPDYGNTYGDRGNGYKYGWNQDRTSNTYERNILPDKQFDTLIEMNGAIWEIEVPNWKYQAVVVCGDPLDPECDDYDHTLIIEGQQSIGSILTISISNPNPPPPYFYYKFKQHIVDVTVNDGKLTIAPATGATPRICFIHITPLVPLQGINWGIPEAFNKHLIYAKKVTGGANLVNGNITYKDLLDINYDPKSKVTSNRTDTYSIRGDNISIPQTDAFVPILTRTSTPSSPSWPSSYTKHFKDNDGNSPYEPSTGYNGLDDLKAINGGIDPYSGGITEFYTFSNCSLNSDSSIFFKKADSSSEVKIRFTNNPNIPFGAIVKSGETSGESADIIIDTLGGSSNIKGQLFAERDIEIQGAISTTIGTQGSYILSAKRNLKIQPTGDLTIDGNIYGEGQIEIISNNNQITINGDVYSPNGQVSISGSGTINISGKVYGGNGINVNGTNINLTINGIISPNTKTFSLQGSGNVVVNGEMRAGLNTTGTINLTVNGNVYAATDVNIGGSGRVEINGSIYVSIGNINIGGSGPVRVNGVIAGKGNITISNSNLKIDARTSTEKAAICRGGNGTLTINASPTIILGGDQYGAILIYSSSGDININAKIDPTYANPDAPDQMAIINRTYNSQININSEVNGAIYSLSNVSINSGGKLYGAIITDKDVILNGGEVNYDSRPYKRNTHIYKGFDKGRRKYVPVIGSWRIEW